MLAKDIYDLPVSLDDLCFNKHEFTKKTFSVDEFLHEHRSAASLEQMRDELGIYLKVLRTAMIELINEDYADFVNLSSNLIGLDDSIKNIQSSLGQLNEEILTIKMILKNTTTELNKCLEQKATLKNHLNSVRCVAKAKQSIETLEKLVQTELESSDNDFDARIFERFTLEIIKLKFNNKFYPSEVTMMENNQKIMNLNNTLMSKLEKHFLNAMHSKDSVNLERCLKIYENLDEQKMAEEIIRKHIVASQMHNIISETALQNCPQGLYEIFTQILNFIKSDMQILLTLTGHNQSQINGFDFAMNSLWDEIEKRLETHMSSIFAPGNPDLFYQKYKNSMNFLNEFDEIVFCHSKNSEIWKNSAQYKSFMIKWNLPVYFQIRFQKIGSTLEKACSTPTEKHLILQPNDKYQLLPFSTVWKCIMECWSPGVYLEELFIRFLTLTLQQLSRISMWIKECLANDNDFWSKENHENEKINFYVYIYMDTKELNRRLPELLARIMEKIPVLIKSNEDSKELLQTCFDESANMLKNALENIQKTIGDNIFLQCSSNLKNVNDIPRLFRKTNKEIPSKACRYVDQVLEPIKNFCEHHSNKFDAGILNGFLLQLFSKLTTKYYSMVDDVLTSVKKTEESLRRLKNLRDKSINNSNLTERGMSDDDKIRLQLYVDVMHWKDELLKLHIDLDEIQKLNDLISLLEGVAKMHVK